MIVKHEHIDKIPKTDKEISDIVVKMDGSRLMAKACVGAVDKDIMIRMYLGTVCIRKGLGTLRL